MGSDAVILERHHSAMTRRFPASTWLTFIQPAPLRELSRLAGPHGVDSIRSSGHHTS